MGTDISKIFNRFSFHKKAPFLAGKNGAFPNRIIPNIPIGVPNGGPISNFSLQFCQEF
jgi:hypothetical protein